MAHRSWNQKVAFTSVLMRNWEEILLFEVHQLCQSALLCTVAAVKDLKSQTRGSFISFTLGRVKGKATGMMKHGYPTLIVFKGRLYVFTFLFNSERGGKL